MSQNRPLISVIIPTYNREEFLKEISIPSVLNQTYPYFELIVVDDHSEDNTEQLIKRWIKRDSRIRYIKNFRKKGVSGARNSGILSARGKYISFLDSDDAWVPEHLERLVKILEQNPDIDIISAAAKMVDLISGKVIKEFYLESFQKTPGFFRGEFYIFTGNIFLLSFTNFICNTLAMLAHKKIFDSLLYPEELTVCEDVYLLHCLCQRGYTFAFLPQIHITWHAHHKNTLDYLQQDFHKRIRSNCELLKYYNNVLNNFNLPENIKGKIKKKKSDIYFWNLAYNCHLLQKQYKEVLKFFIKGLYLEPINLLKWKTFLLFNLSLPFRLTIDLIKKEKK